MAAGVTLAEENDEAFRDRLEQAVREAATDELMIPVQEYDAELPFAAADDVLLDALSQLEPFGLGNPAPVFFTGGAQVLRRRACGAQGAHLQLTLRQGDKLLSGVGFGMVEVSWANTEGGSFNATINIIAYDHVSLLGELALFIGNLGVPIVAVSAKRDDKRKTSVITMTRKTS